MLFTKLLRYMRTEGWVTRRITLKKQFRKDFWVAQCRREGWRLSVPQPRSHVETAHGVYGVSGKI